MSLQKNVASQKWRVFAFNKTTNAPITGDAANITAKIAKDWAAAGATNDVNPTETEDGYYNFDLLQAETNADMLDLFPESSTGDIQVIGVPGTQSTIPPTFADLDIASGRVDVGKLNGVAQSLLDLKDFADAGYDPITNKIQGLVLLDAVAATGLDNVLKTSDFALAMADANWDEVLTGAEHNVVNSAGRRLRFLQEAGNYLGAIHVDTLNGVAGTTDFENGTDSNPVDSIADANTLATSLGISTFHIAAGSTITLAVAQNDQVFTGSNWTLALNGKDIAGSVFIGAEVSGIATGTGTTQQFFDCLMNGAGSSHIKGTHFRNCGLLASLAMVEAGAVFFDNCHSGIAGTGSITFDFGAALNASQLNVRHHSGGFTIENMGAGTGTYNATFEGVGQVIFAASCSATSNASVRGNWTITDNAGGAVTVTLDDTTLDIIAILADTDELQNDDVPSLIAALNDPTAAAVADAVLDELLAGHSTIGSLGKAISDIEVDAAAIKVQTDKMVFTIANQLDINVQYVNDVLVIGTGGLGDEWRPTP